MDGDSKQSQNIEEGPVNMVHDTRPIFQSVWIRHSTVLADSDDWKSMGRQFRFVLCSGTVLWIIHAISLYI